MKKPSFADSLNPRISSLVVLALLAMVAIPAGITLHTVRAPAIAVPQSSNPTPYGYTWSLLLFIVPILLIGGWFVPLEEVAIPRRAFRRTIWVLTPIGFSLDFFFAKAFLCFPNSAATLSIQAPALGEFVPVEEYIFYFTGFLAVLLLYIWMDEFWLSAYNVKDYRAEARDIERFLRFHPASVVIGLILIAIAVAYKKLLSHNPDGFPGYFTFLVITALVPAAAFFPEAKRFINWRALSLTLFIVLLISLFWETTLAVPYGWWGYRSRQMMGLSIGAWSQLPIEAVCVWIAVTYMTIIIFEVMKMWDASSKPLKVALLGTTASNSARKSLVP